MNCANCSQPKEHHTHDVLCPTNDADAVEAYHNDSDPSYFSIYQPEFPKYLNVYRVEKAYGGPEEGGWWFDYGDPLESVRVDNQEEYNMLYGALMRRYDLDAKGKYYTGLHHKDNPNLDRERVRGRTSAAGGYDICIYSQYHFAKPFPEEEPRYE